MKIAATQFSLINRSFEIYISGCNGYPKCKGCHNEELWSYDIGEDYNLLLENILDKVKRFDNIIDNIMIMGGEPLDQDIVFLIDLIEKIKQANKQIWLFTRHELNDVPEKVKKSVQYIKTGKYIQELKTEENIQYGIKLATSNQNIYKKGKDF